MDMLNDLRIAGYNAVFMKPKFPVRTISSYDEAILKEVKGPLAMAVRPRGRCLRFERRQTRTFERPDSVCVRDRLASWAAGFESLHQNQGR